MITEAIVLGAVEAALYREDDIWRAVRLASDTDSLIDCSRHLSLLLSSGAEQRYLPSPLRDLDELAVHLRDWSRRHRALTMLISGMDNHLTDNTRRTCIRDAEHLMDDSDTAQFVRARLLGCPLPDEADLDGGLRLLSEITASRVRAFYEQLHNRNIKFRIIRARNTLERILFSQFDLGLVLDSTRRTIIDAGIVADAVLALARDDSDRFEELLSTHSGSTAVPASIREPANLIRQFATLLNEPWVHLAKDWPEIASVLRENDRWYPTETYLIGLQEVRCFITALWNTDPSLFSEKMRGTLLWSMIYCAKRLDRFMKGATGSDLVQASIAGTRAYLYCSKIERASATLNWGSRLSNLCQALILAHRARFFEDRAKYLEHVMWEELGQVQDMLPEEPHALLTSSPMSSPKDTFYLMANAATAFYFGAIMHANFGGERDDALRALHAAQKYFQAASTYFDRVPNGRRLVFQRRARALTLEGRLLLHSGHGGTERALEVLDHAINLLEMVNVADDLEGGLAPHRILQAQALIEKARILPEDLTIAVAVEEILGEAILKRPEDAAPRKLLLDYYLEVKKNAEAALDSLDGWVEDWKAKGLGDRSTKRGVLYLQYLAAHLCGIASRDDMSLAVPAVKRFSMLVRDQPWNTKAAEELLDLVNLLSTDELNQAREIIDNILPSLSNEECNVTHAVVRLLVGSVDNDIEKALEVIEKKARESWVSTVLEPLSKKYFEHERRNPFETGFIVTNRLLTLALEIDPNDAISMSRKLEIMRFRRFGSEVQALIDEANQCFSRDPIIKVQAARLLTAHGTPESIGQANQLLHEAISLGQDERTDDVHPAILDQLAYLAFLRDDLDEAEVLYQNVLDAYPHDSRAHFGLGRVCFERGVAYWPRALTEWLATSRTQLLSDEPEAPAVLWRTVCSVAGLFDARYHKFSGKIRSKLLEQLKNIQGREDPALTSPIVEALQVLGIVDQPVVDAILDGVSGIVDGRLRRSIAQFLMASTIYSLLGAGLNGVCIRRAIEWCRERGVLAEYLAGAKGSYTRALIGLQSSGKYVEQVLSQLQGSLSGLARNGDWNCLFGHLATLGYKPNYYSNAYRLVDEMNNPRTDQLEDFVRHLVWEIAHRIWAKYSDKEALLESLKPSLVLCPLRLVLSIEEHELRRPSIGGWVDIVPLEFISHELEREYGEPKRWHVQGAELVCDLPSLWQTKNISTYPKFGLYPRRAESSDGAIQLCIDLSSGLEHAA